jgi:hypothetical protein
VSWCVEEYSEDAVKAYLVNKLEDTAINCYVAWSNDVLKYPCCVIHAGKSSNVEGTNFTGIRAVSVSIAVMTEAITAGGKSARDNNRAARDAVIKALAQTALHDDINALEPSGVVFSLAYVSDVTRSVETDQRVFVSEIELITIASPKDLI